MQELPNLKRKITEKKRLQMLIKEQNDEIKKRQLEVLRLRIQSNEHTMKLLDTDKQSAEKYKETKDTKETKEEPKPEIKEETKQEPKPKVNYVEKIKNDIRKGLYIQNKEDKKKRIMAIQTKYNLEDQQLINLINEVCEEEDME